MCKRAAVVLEVEIIIADNPGIPLFEDGSVRKRAAVVLEVEIIARD